MRNSLEKVAPTQCSGVDFSSVLLSSCCSFIFSKLSTQLQAFQLLLENLKKFLNLISFILSSSPLDVLQFQMTSEHLLSPCQFMSVVFWGHWVGINAWAEQNPPEVTIALLTKLHHCHVTLLFLRKLKATSAFKQCYLIGILALVNAWSSSNVYCDPFQYKDSESTWCSPKLSFWFLVTVSGVT